MPLTVLPERAEKTDRGVHCARCAKGNQFPRVIADPATCRKRAKDVEPEQHFSSNPSRTAPVIISVDHKRSADGWTECRTAAKREGKELIYAGKVGTGFNHKTSIDVRKRLQPLITAELKLTRKVRKPKAKWVELKYAAEIEYRDITSDGLLRASSFKGPADLV